MNFLLIQADQQRRDSLPCYRNDIARTPNIDSLCRDGTVFDNAFCPSPICAPARASLITGKRPVHHGILHNRESGIVAGKDFVGEHASVANLLKPLGFRSTLCGKWHVGTELPPSECGFEGVFHPGYGYPDRHPDYLSYLERLGCAFRYRDEFRGTLPGGGRGYLFSAVQEGPVEASIPHYLAEQAINAMRHSVENDEAFLVRCDFWGPHAPFIIPEPYYSMYRPDDMPEWPNFRDELAGKPSIQRTMKEYWGVQDFTWAEWSRLAALCYGYVSLIDFEVGRMLEALDELGITGDTAVFYTSDHGGMVGSHGLCDKGPHLYDEEIRIPLIARLPGAPKGRRSAAFCYNMDLTPTILDMAGAEIPQDLDSESLLPVIRGEKERVREPVAYVEFHGHQGPYSQRMVRTENAKHIFNAPEFDELYDLRNDPHELVNLIDDPARSNLLAEMRRLLLRCIRETNDPILRFFETTRLQSTGEPPG